MNCEKIYNNPDIYKIDVILPNNPLRNLNCYVVKTESGTLMIDTGFNQPECLAALSSGMETLEIDMDSTTLFLTHLHGDHVGLVNDIATDKTRVIMSRVDYEYLKGNFESDNWDWMEKKFIKEGLDEEVIRYQREVNPARVYGPKYLFRAETVEDGDTFTVGKYTFRCLYTPGHTPGHMCLYMEDEGIIFLGDYVLFDITPNITMWRNVEDSLGNYLESLKRIEKLDIKTALPAHRKNEMNVFDRIEQIKKHHDIRLKQVVEILKKEPGLNACTLGSRMTWSMRGKNWEEFPIQQKWFAIGETIAHLDYLMARGLVTKVETENACSYYAV